MATEPHPLRDRVRRALVWQSGGQVAAQLVLWGSTLVCLRLLNPADYGLIAMAEVATGFLTLLSGQSLANALVQARTVTERQVAQIFGLLLAVGAVLALLQFALAPLVAGFYREPQVAAIMRVIAVNFLLIPFIAMPTAIAQRAIDFRAPALAGFAALISASLASVALALSGAGVWALVAGQVVLFALRAGGLALAVRWLRWPVFRWDGVRPLIAFGGTAMGTSIIWFIYAQADIVIAGRVLDAHAVGIYSTALFLALLPVAKFIPVLNEVGFAAYSQVQEDAQSFRTAFLKALRLVALVTFPVFFGLAASAPVLIPAAMGPQWEAAVPIVRVLALVMPLNALANLYSPALNALGLPRVPLGTALFGLMIMPAAFLVGVQQGVLGLALAWAAAFPLYFAIATARALPRLGISAAALAQAAGPALAASAAMGAAVAGAAATVGRAGVAEALALVALGAALYAALLWTLFPTRARELLALARR